MKVFVLAPGEGWIVDRMASEFKQYFAEIVTDDPEEADVIWLMADWCWERLPYELLQRKKVLTYVHHIVPEKFGREEQINFMFRGIGSLMPTMFPTSGHRSKSKTCTAERLLKGTQEGSSALQNFLGS